MSELEAFRPSLPSVLVVDDDRAMAQLLGGILRGIGYDVTYAHSMREARDQIANRFFPIILCDINLGPGTGLDLMSATGVDDNQSLFIFITGDAKVSTAMTAIRQGAFEYLSKPDNLDQLQQELIATMERACRRLSVEFSALRRIEPGSLASPQKRIVGRSSRMVGVYRALANAALHQGNVLILGETGTGKEQIARTIHSNSPWADKPFVAVNCGALTDTLLESELFGHVRGSFTGATCNKRGLFEEASGGTIFLDEIGDISLALQMKLLRTLQEKEIKPVGSSETKRISVRVIAATNRNLEEAIRESLFREDLYFRLKVFLVEIPPLRDRLEDLPELVDYFIADAAASASKPIVGLAKGVIELLRQYSWPGNVRELENAVTRAVVSARSNILFPEDFPREIIEKGKVESAGSQPLAPIGAEGSAEKRPTLAEIERDYILTTLRSVNFRKMKAAEILGIDRVTLYRKISRYGISGSTGTEKES